MLSVLKKRPLMRTMMAYAFVNVTADALEQNLISKKKVYNTSKTVRVTLVGTFLIAPLVFNWIRLTEKLLPSKKVTAVLTKVLCDQFLFAPVAITTFYIGTNILERQKDLLAEWKQKLFPTWTTGMMFWPIAQTINFRFIPWELKTIYMPCCSLIWTTYLCYMKEKGLCRMHVELQMALKDQDLVTAKVLRLTKCWNACIMFEANEKKA